MKLISSVGANDIVTMGFNPWIGNNPPLKVPWARTIKRAQKVSITDKKRKVTPAK